MLRRVVAIEYSSDPSIVFSINYSPKLHYCGLCFQRIVLVRQPSIHPSIFHVYGKEAIGIVKSLTSCGVHKMKGWREKMEAVRTKSDTHDCRTKPGMHGRTKPDTHGRTKSDMHGKSSNLNQNFSTHDGTTSTHYIYFFLLIPPLPPFYEITSLSFKGNSVPSRYTRPPFPPPPPHKD